MRLFSRCKNLLVPRGRREVRVPSGLFRGLRLQLDLGSQFQLYAGLFEHEVAAYVRQYARDAKSYIDVGAGQGEYVLYFAAQPSMEAVVAFEPDAAEREILLANIAANSPRASAGARAGARVEVRGDMVGIAAPFARLDDIAHPAQPVVIKVDVEGAETLVLGGAQRLIAETDSRWIIETHAREYERECAAMLEQAGYRVKVIPHACWRVLVPEERPNAENRWLVARR